jgi:nicotinamide-nucleotide amidase
MRAGLEEAARRRDRPLDRRAERLALLPQGASVWREADADPAWTVEGPDGAVVVLSRGGGLPAALGARLSDVARQRVGRGILTRTLKTACVSVGELEERLAPWLGAEASARDVAVSTVPADGEVWVRLVARGATPDAATRALGRVEPEVLAALGADCYGRDADTLERAVGRLLLARGLTLAVAESCTGGLLGHRLTSVGGSSAYFERGLVVYSNRAKQELLGVPPALLAQHGAVSGPCAEAMARGICERAGTACGLAITGIAGPDGGTPAKPVGTVFVGVAVAGQVAAHRFHFRGDRAAVKSQSAQAALDLLRRRLGEG